MNSKLVEMENIGTVGKKMEIEKKKSNKMKNNHKLLAFHQMCLDRIGQENSVYDKHKIKHFLIVVIVFFWGQLIT